VPDFRFDEATHTYWLDGVQLPGVSSIIAPCVGDLSVIPAATLERKANLGKYVHEMAHLYDLGLVDRADLAACDHPGYATAWASFTDKHEPQWDVMEKPLYCPTRRYAGTPDRAGTMLWEKQRIAVTFDIKCVYTLRPSTSVQLAAYAILLDRTDTRRFAVKLCPDGTYQIKEYPDEVPMFLSLLNVHNWRVKHGITG
jgi:hypothetical protein